MTRQQTCGSVRTPQGTAGGPALALAWIETVKTAYQRYTPFSFWDALDVYVEMWVEQVDLRSLFSPICATFALLGRST
jgi:hypothetical protein